MKGLTHWIRKTVGEKSEFRIERDSNLMSIKFEKEQNLSQFLIEI